MKKHIWKKSFSISFVFHFIVVITIGAMVAGFHQEIQRPKEELITVNLADTPEQIAKAQEKSSFNSFSKDIENIFKHNSDNDNQNIENKNNVVNPEGTVYFEANSATGSKYYQLIGTQQNYIAARSQSWRPTYSVIDFTETTLTVKTYDAATNTELVADGNIKTSYTIVKSVEKEDLKKEIESAEVKLGEVKAAGTYTEESVQKLSDTIDAAKAIYENAESTTTDVASAVTSLQEAVSALKAVDNGENGNDTDNNISSGDSTSDGNNAGNAGTADDNAGTSGNGQTSGNSTTQTGTATTAKSNVQTGDNAFPTVLWFSLGAASLAGLGYIAVTEKKRKNEN